MLQQRFVAAHAHVGGNVVGLGAADERMDQQSVDAFERHLGNVFVRAMDRVTRLEGDDRLPAAIGERSPRFGRRLAIFGEVVVRHVRDERDRAAEINRPLGAHRGHARVLILGGGEYALRFLFLIGPVLARDRHRRDDVAVGMRERDVRIDGHAGPTRFIELERDGDRPGQTLRQALVREDAVVLFLGHEAFERAVDAGRDAFEIGHGAFGEFDAR